MSANETKAYPVRVPLTFEQRKALKRLQVERNLRSEGTTIAEIIKDYLENTDAGREVYRPAKKSFTTP